jgi:hypothetical protein
MLGLWQPPERGTVRIPEPTGGSREVSAQEHADSMSIKGYNAPITFLCGERLET